jgi:hypothetical protein
MTMPDRRSPGARSQGETCGVENGGMTRPELRVFLSDHFCGCGSPEAASAALLRLLRLHPLYDHRAEFKAWVPDDGIEYLLLYALDRWELTEHGGSAGGAWLTPKGEAVRDALTREEADGFEALNGNYCVHGYDVDDESHDCMKVTER